MSTSSSRRTFLSSIAAGAVALGAGTHLASGQTPQASPVMAGPQWGGIGLTRDAWEALAGPGETVGDFVRYTSPVDGATPVVVGYTDGVITFMEYDFPEADGSGASLDDASAMIAASMPPDAGLVETFLIENEQWEPTSYRAERFTSQQLGELPGGLTSVLVTTHLRDPGRENEQGSEPVVARVALTVPGPQTLEFRVTGNPGGIGLSQAEWNERYSEVTSPQDGNLYENMVVLELQLMVNFSPEDRADLITTVFPGELPPLVTYGEATPLVSSLVPEDATRRATFQIPSTPNVLSAYTVEIWESPSLTDITDGTGSILAWYEQAVDTNPVTVSRLAVALPVEPEALAERSPEA